MIALLTGRIDQLTDSAVVLDVNGVGYLVFCSSRTLDRLPPVREAVRLLIETHVREDHIHLYGFADEAERDWFRLLTTVQGVGARLALAVLSAAGPDELARAVLAQDRTFLTRADGVGPRLAARIVNELKDKAGGLAIAHPLAVAAGAVPAVREGAAADALSALVNLGYRRAEAFGAVTIALGHLGGGATTDALTRSALQELARSNTAPAVPGAAGD